VIFAAKRKLESEEYQDILSSKRSTAVNIAFRRTGMRFSDKLQKGVIVKIVLGADLHGFLPRVPSCDFLILAGDILPNKEQRRFVEKQLKPWLEQVPAEHIVATWGNHDWLPFYGWSSNNLSWHLLVDEGIELKGLNFYCLPWSLPFREWAWMVPEKTLEKLYSAIPNNTDVLVTHTPPFGILDQNFRDKHCGSRSLLRELGRLNELKLVVCGHIHEARGREGKIINACCVEGTSVARYRLNENPWTIVEI